MDTGKIPGSKDKLLFTPGPLTTSRTVKQAMLRDLGSRDFEFIETIQHIRAMLLAAAGVEEERFTSIVMQGSGTFGIEAVISSAIPPKGKLLVIVNGAYGRRILQIAAVHRIDAVKLEYPENERPVLADIRAILDKDASITDVAVIHCETTTGIINPVEEIGAIVKKAGRRYIVDAMSSFGAIPVNVEGAGIDYLISSANKCIEGVPGFSFVIARKETLQASKGWARTLSLDLLAQVAGLDKNGQFRFTPPTHALIAFHQALTEFVAEGGVEGRARRYRANHDALADGMRALGFKEYLPCEMQSYIITTYYYPAHPNFSFEKFYSSLNQKGYAIYPGKLSQADCFRIGTIGRLFPEDMRNLLAAIKDTLKELNIKL